MNSTHTLPLAHLALALVEPARLVLRRAYDAAAGLVLRLYADAALAAWLADLVATVVHGRALSGLDLALHHLRAHLDRPVTVDQLVAWSGVEHRRFRALAIERYVCCAGPNVPPPTGAAIGTINGPRRFPLRAAMGHTQGMLPAVRGSAGLGTRLRIAALLLATPLAAGATVSDPVQVVLRKHCIDCHGGATAKGGIDIEALLVRPASGAALAHWEQAMQVIAAGEMPPAKRPQPSPEQRQLVVEWVTGALAAAADPTDPGPLVVRRLTRHELERSVAVVTGAELGVAGMLAADGSGGAGFAGSGAVQRMPPEQLEACLEVAWAIADRLVVTDAGVAFAPPPGGQTKGASDARIQALAQQRRAHWLPACHRRTLRAALAVRSGTDAARAAAEHGVERERLDAALAALTGPAPAALSATQLEKHSHRWIHEDWAGVRAAFTELAAARVPGEPELAARIDAIARGIAALARRSDGKTPPPAIAAAIARGFPDGRAFADATALTPGRGGSPAAARALLDEAAAAELDRLAALARSPATGEGAIPAQRAWLAELAAAAWRRPLDERERADLAAFYDARRRAGDGHEAALRAGVARVFAAPDFWYLLEASRPGRRHALSGRELAARLGYALWSAPPDAELARCAEDGSLLRDEVLRAQTRRLLADPRAAGGLVEACFLVWLGLDRFIEQSVPDPQRFGREYRPALAAAMIAETRAVLADLVRNDGRVDDLLGGSWTYLDGALARHYGIDGIAGPVLRRVEVAGADRGGLLGQGAVLVATSLPLRTSPVRRGSWLLQEVLGRELPPPPPDAGQLPDDDRGGDGLSLAQRLERHRRDQSCAVCHQLIDPLGFPLEAFDVLGRRRTHDVNGVAVEARATTRDGSVIDGPAGLRRWLTGQAPRVRRQLASKLAGYALGRAIGPADRHLVDAMVAASDAAGGRLWPMVETLVLSVQFRQRRGADAAPSPGATP